MTKYMTIFYMINGQQLIQEHENAEGFIEVRKSLGDNWIQVKVTKTDRMFLKTDHIVSIQFHEHKNNEEDCLYDYHKSNEEAETDTYIS